MKRFTSRVQRLVPILAAATALVLLASCAPGMGSPDGVTYSYREVPVYEEVPIGDLSMSRAPGNGKGPRVEDFSYTIYQVAQLDPVVVDGTTVQANDIVISGSTAAIAYNTAGPVFAGAIQIVNVSNPNRPVITAELAFPGVDITTLELDGSTLYFGGSISPDHPSANERSFLATLDLADLSSQTLEVDTIDNAVTFNAFTTELPPYDVYYFTTGIAAKDGTIWVSSGADPGGVFTVDAGSTVASVARTGDPDPAPEADATDIRDIEAYHGGVIAVAGTADADGKNVPGSSRVMLIDAGGIDSGATLPLKGDLDDETKATIEVFDRHFAFLGLSNAGFQVVFLRDKDAGTGELIQPIYEIPNPEVGWSSRTATNSASHSGDLVFTANGEAGFRVFQATEKLKRNRPPDAGWLKPVGFVPFDGTRQPSGDFWSANHIEYRDETLFVAAGLGGVVVYRIVAE